MIIDQVFGSKKYNISQVLEKEYGHQIAKKVLEKTGPRDLFIASDEESALTLGIDACNNLINKLKIEGIDYSENVKNIFSVTESPEMLFPGNATQIASTLNLSEDTSVFDINAGCTGFVDAIRLSIGMNHSSFIICSETYSKHWKKFNRAVSALFADAAAAIYFDPNEWKILHSSGKYQANTSKLISSPHGAPNTGEVVMAGKDVANFVNSIVIPTIKDILNQDFAIDRGYFHQGSLFVVETIQSKLGKYIKSIPSNICERGNSVSATLPILIHDDIKNNQIKSGETILIAGFGVGLALSVCILQKK
jgi:3-oxoacyl-[acyl-carrier-protein] synthase-3